MGKVIPWLIHDSVTREWKVDNDSSEKPEDSQCCGRLQGEPLSVL